MLWVFIGLLGGFAFVFLTRLYWADAANQPDGRAPPRQPLVTLALATLVIALLVMIATGRLNWLGAALTGAIPFLRRGLSMLRYTPLFASLISKAQDSSAPWSTSKRSTSKRSTSKRSNSQRPGSEQPNSTTRATGAGLNIDQARAVLEVPKHASKDQIVAAHRRLMGKNHPDRGGSNYIAAQLNEAKALLLKNAPPPNL